MGKYNPTKNLRCKFNGRYDNKINKITQIINIFIEEGISILFLIFMNKRIQIPIKNGENPKNKFPIPGVGVWF